MSLSQHNVEPSTQTTSSLPSASNPNPQSNLDTSESIQQTTGAPSPASMPYNGASRNGRAKRFKKDSRKKKEARGVDATEGLVERKPTAVTTSSSAIPSSELTMLMPLLLTDPRPADVLHPKPRQMNFVSEKRSDVLGKSWNFYEVADKLNNRNGFRYTYAVTDPGFPHTKYRQTDVPPYYSRFSYEDSPAAINFTSDSLGVTTGDSWHSARANVCAREGTYYYETRVISGIVEGSPIGASPRGHVRLGFSRREADLDVSVGVDCYGYGIRDVNGEVVNRMRCEYFFPKGEAIHEGDVIGMLITLPPLWLHKKIVDGTYDPDVDGDGSNIDPITSYTPTPMNLIRDRIPFHLKSDFLYQQGNIFPSKHLRDYAFNLKETPTYGRPSPQNTEDPSLRTLPGSSITIYKNGTKMGTPFTELYAFLPPASRATQANNNLGIGERENADDGMIGYFPTVSCHNGGAVECRFEGPWWVGPPVEEVPHVRPFGDRFGEQIVEDALADVVDEVEAMFAGWNTEGGNNGLPVPSSNNERNTSPTPAQDTRPSGATAGYAGSTTTGMDDGASVSVGTPQIATGDGDLDMAM